MYHHYPFKIAMASESTFSVIVFAWRMFMTIIDKITTDNRIDLLIRCDFVFSILEIIHCTLLLCMKNSISIISNISIRYDIVIDDTDLSLQFCTSVSVTRITRQTLTDVFLLISNPCWFTFCILITVSLYVTARFYKTFNVRIKTINC